MNKRAFIEYAAPLLCERHGHLELAGRVSSASSAVYMAESLWEAIERIVPGRAVATPKPDPTLGGIFPR